MLKRYGFSNADEMYAAIGFGGITAAKVITRLRDSYQNDHKEEIPPETIAKQIGKKTADGGLSLAGGTAGADAVDPFLLEQRHHLRQQGRRILQIRIHGYNQVGKIDSRHQTGQQRHRDRQECRHR